MGRYTNRIEAAIGHAVPLPDLSQAPGPDEAAPAAATPDDNEPLVIGGLPSEANAIIVASPDDFLDLEFEVTASFGAEPGAFYRRGYAHEIQHAVAARLLGIRAIAYGYRFYETLAAGETVPTVAAYAFTAFPERLLVPRLGFAAILAYPAEPSPDDLALLAGLGYDVAAVGRKTIAYNEQYPYPLPVPLSYRPGSAAIDLPF